jgi:type VI secretion system secreted protein VgrG
MHAQFDHETVVEHDETRKVKNNRSTDIGVDDTLDVGDHLHITAGTEIVLTTGMSKITMKKDGTITIEGRDITVKASQQLSTSAIMADHSGDATMTIKGGIIKIN